MRKKIEKILWIMLIIAGVIFVPWLAGPGITDTEVTFIVSWLSGLVAIALVGVFYVILFFTWTGISKLWNKMWNKIEKK